MLSETDMKRVLILVALLLAPGAFAHGANFTGGACKGVIHGVLIDAHGQPVGDMELTLYPLGVDLAYILPVTKSDGAGRYKFETVCPGTYTVYPTNEAAGYPYINPHVSAHLSGNNQVPGVFLSTEHSDAEFDVDLPPKPAFLIVHAINGETKAAIADESVRLTLPKEPKSHWVGSIGAKGGDSMFTIPIPSNTDILVRVLCDGYHEWQDGRSKGKIIHLAPGTRMTLEVQLRPRKG